MTSNTLFCIIANGVNEMDIQTILIRNGQNKLLERMKKLNENERKELTAQLESVDWETIQLWKKPFDEIQKGEIKPIEGLKLRDIAAKKEEFLRTGVSAVKAGKVAAVLLAGGMGTRLGSDMPKGAYNIGVAKPLYIFEQLIRNLQVVCNDCDAVVPLYIMTSEQNDKTTRTFFNEHNYFGYPKDSVRFFMQETAACVDFEGNLLFESGNRLALSPNGNGGWYSSMERAGLVDEAKKKGVEWFNVFAVDNVLQHIADPAFVGAAILNGTASAAKVVCKANPHEKVGVLCLEDGLPSVIEYYELSEEMANLRAKNGELLYTYGVILNYLFRLDKLEQIAKQKIPVHVVKKKITHVDENGNVVKPETENGYKFETLILDMIRLMGSCLPYEVVREKEFAPIKNQTGVDSVDTARVLLQKNGVEL